MNNLGNLELIRIIRNIHLYIYISIQRQYE